MENSVKQVIVMRKDLGMRRGKQIAQGAHASMKVILDMMQKSTSEENSTSEFPRPSIKYITRTLVFNDNSPTEHWLSGAFTKICVYVNSEEELDEIMAKAKESNIHCALIIDNGATEFNGVKTKTCCAIGPDWSDTIDTITGDLPLL